MFSSVPRDFVFLLILTQHAPGYTLQMMTLSNLKHRDETFVVCVQERDRILGLYACEKSIFHTTNNNLQHMFPTFPNCLECLFRILKREAMGDELLRVNLATGH